MRQQTERFRFGKRIIFWDPRQGAAPRALTSRAVDCLRFRPEISLHRQMDEALSLIEAYPWADIFVSDRWVPLILEIAAQNLHLCLHAAILHLPAVMQPGELEAAQRAVREVLASEALLDYLQTLIAATRSGQWFVEGLSPRAGIAVLRVAKARALMAQRDYVAPDDVQAILPQAIAHRLLPIAGAGRGAIEQVRAMVEATPIP